MTNPKLNEGAARGSPEADGYPTEAAMARIQGWPWEDWQGLLNFVHGLWWAEGWGWTEGEEDGRPTYSISTGGWSGNEDLIAALEANRTFWTLNWYSSRRGGHYEFRPTVAEGGTGAASAAQPPVDNDHVAPGCQPFDEATIRSSQQAHMSGESEKHAAIPIATALWLYEALRTLVREAAGVHQCGMGFCDPLHAAVGNARAALAKAEGRARPKDAP